MLVFADRWLRLDPNDAYYRIYRHGTGWTTDDAMLLENRSEPAGDTQVVMNSSGVAMVSWRQLTGVNDTNRALGPTLEWVRVG